jgi:hypothetical protein
MIFDLLLDEICLRKQNRDRQPTTYDATFPNAWVRLALIIWKNTIPSPPKNLATKTSA